MAWIAKARERRCLPWVAKKALGHADCLFAAFRDRRAATFQEISIRNSQAFAEVHGRPPSQGRKPGSIEKLARGTVRLARVKRQSPVESNHFGNESGEFANGLVPAAANVDERRFLFAP